MAETRIRLIGVDVARSHGVELHSVKDCTAIVVSKRIRVQLSHLEDRFRETKIIPIAPVDEAFEQIDVELKKGNVTVFASGDPLFFGIAKRIVTRFGRDIVDIFPALSSMQLACSAFKISWDDAEFISLHGRKDGIPVGRIVSRKKTALLTDNICRPDVIANKIFEFLDKEKSKRFQVHIAENIGMEGEKLVTTTLQQAATMEFGGLCCMIITRKVKKTNHTRFGLEEKDIHHSRGLITKSEVRAAIIHSLGVEPGCIMWDIGAGSGSVSIECARLMPDMLIYAVEKEVEQNENITSNIVKYDLFNVNQVKGMAPAALQGLPAPDRIFIGGSGGNLAEIVDYCADSISEGGRIVISAVLEKTRNDAPRLLYQKGFEVVTKTISVSRKVYPEKEEQVFNPITIILGHNKKGNSHNE
ncbi:precorrin-6y C5,15-methyltransferase (decarboxylating) subunit CbiE [Desulfopila sp. IMCC35008]|uniref:precorrin-6y C5,15-methyltransferase (decarboxylating) subunit CbiE n=1 Tax=Desulfopila sp. IMCC35008 TaxID=2653858 RepID=UPI0013D5D14D|nr:precorrin-6y C5,15-methyltransferase (decarboxylating) subunit CbiE [Desulfopila sp. IMCC35008]